MAFQSVAAMVPLECFLGEAEAPRMWKKLCWGLMKLSGETFSLVSQIRSSLVSAGVDRLERCWLWGFEVLKIQIRDEVLIVR